MGSRTEFPGEMTTAASLYEESGDGAIGTTNGDFEHAIILSVTLKGQANADSFGNTDSIATTADLYLALAELDETTTSVTDEDRLQPQETTSASVNHLHTTLSTPEGGSSTSVTAPVTANESSSLSSEIRQTSPATLPRNDIRSTITMTPAPSNHTSHHILNKITPMPQARIRNFTVVKQDQTTRQDLATSLLGLPLAAANSTIVWVGTGGGRLGGGGESEGNSDDIIPIVGVICAVVGVLLGVILSACVWLYVSRRRTRLHRNSRSIKKNPEEKTFERLDFNLTLPREQDVSSPPEMGYDHTVHDFQTSEEPPVGSSYRHFEEPTPFATDVLATVRPLHPRSIFDDDSSNGRSSDFSPCKGQQLMRHNDDTSLDYRSEVEFGVFTDILCLPATEHGRRHAGHHSPSEPPRSSYIALVQHDSDQSTISRLSSIATIEGNRRSSSCTYRTDLPDSDGSNCSVGGGSTSMTGSLARDRTHHPLSNSYVGRGQDLLPSESSYFSDVNTMSTRAASPLAISHDRVRSTGKGVSDERDDVSITCSETSFADVPSDDTSDVTTATKEMEREDSAERSLSYFDLHLPPSTFSTSHDQAMQARTLSTNSASSEGSDSSKFENTIHL